VLRPQNPFCITGGSVPAVLETDTVISDIRPKSTAIDIAEGDWKAYLQHIKKCGENKDLMDRYGSVAAYKRACALAYLGKRAQLYGGVCSMRHPHIMTKHFIATLEDSNKATRFARYPWLSSLMTLLAEIEQIQDQISNANVISLVPPNK
jgi:hypothetical protein